MSDEGNTIPSESLGQRVVKGAAWTIIAQITINVVRLLGNLLSTKLIDPDAYGLMAVVITVVTGLLMFSDIGIEQSVVYDERGEEPQFLKTAFSLHVIRGFVLAALAVILTEPLIWFFQEPRLRSLLPIVGLQTIFAGLTSMKFAWNKRKVQSMREVAFVEIGAQLAAFVVVITLAFILRSVWALAISSLIFGAVRMILTYVLLDGPKDGLAWDGDSIRRIMTYGRWIFVSTFITFLSVRFDVFAVGALAGMSTLGLYHLALMLTSTLNTIGFQVTQSVLFPALSEAARTNDKDILRKTFERSRKVVLPIGLWCITALTYLAPPFYYYLYREEFASAGWILQCQITFVWFVFLTDAWTRALMVVDDNRSMAIANVVRLGGAVLFAPIGFYIMGIAGLIFGLALASLTAHAWVHYALDKHGLNAVWLDVVYTVTAIPLLSLGAFGPTIIGKMIEWHPMAVSILLSFIVGIPFTAGLAIYLKFNIKAARQPVAAAGSVSPAI